MATTPKPRKPTDAQLALLRNLAAGREADAGLFGMSARGGFESTRASCYRRGWLTKDVTLTPAGLAIATPTAAKVTS